MPEGLWRQDQRGEVSVNQSSKPETVGRADRFRAHSRQKGC